MSCPYLLHETVLERSKCPQAGSFPFIYKFHAAIFQHLSAT